MKAKVRGRSYELSPFDWLIVQTAKPWLWLGMALEWAGRMASFVGNGIMDDRIRPQWNDNEDPF